MRINQVYPGCGDGVWGVREMKLKMLNQHAERWGGRDRERDGGAETEREIGTLMHTYTRTQGLARTRARVKVHLRRRGDR